MRVLSENLLAESVRVDDGRIPVKQINLLERQALCLRNELGSASEILECFFKKQSLGVDSQRRQR